MNETGGNKKGTVLLTRPLQDATSMTAELQEAGYEVICEPFIRIVHNRFTLPLLKNYSGLIVTSVNAVRAIKPQINRYNIPVYCVGKQTKAQAKEAGFTRAVSANGKVSDLVTLLASVDQLKPLLYVRGEEISHDLKPLLPNVQIAELVVYRVETAKQISDKLVYMMQIGKISHIAFFSKRTAETFMDILHHHSQSKRLIEGLKRTRALCLGDSMVESLSDITWQEIEVADQPQKESLIQLLR